MLRTRFICAACSAAVLFSFWFQQTAWADSLTLDNTCGSNIWQDCCDCNINQKCINWDRPPTSAPVCPTLPGSADDVMIGIDCEVSDLFAAAAANTITQTAGTFTVNGDLGIGNLATFDGPVVWNSGSIGRSGGAAGQQAICNGGLTIQGDDPKTLSVFGGFTLTNTANGTWNGAGDWTIGMIPGACCPAILENATGALFDVQTDADILQTAFGLGLIQNDGTLRKSASNGVSDWKVSLINDGLVEVQSGELRLTGDGEATGEFNVSAGATLTFATPFFFEFKQGISFTGPGDAVLVDTGSNFGVLVNETIDLNRFRVANSGSIGPVSNFGHINVTDLLQLDGADIRPPMTIKPGARLEHTGPNESFVGDLSVEGIVDVLQGRLSTANKTITVQPGGVVEIRDNADLKTSGLVSQPIQNFGTVQKTTGAGTASIVTDFGAPFLNNAGGLVHAASGTLRFGMNVVGQGGDWQIDQGAVLDKAFSFFGGVFELNAGTIRGGGTLVVNRLNNTGGTVSPGASPGILTLASSTSPAAPGDYTQLAAGKLEIEVAGLTAGTQHDRLDVQGVATLDGTLEVALINGFVPKDADQVTILTSPFVTGQFANVVLTNFPAGVAAQVVYNTGSVVLSFTDSNPVNAPPTNNTPPTNNNGDGGGGTGNPPITPSGNPAPQPTATQGTDCGDGACGGGMGIMMPMTLFGFGFLRRRRRRH